MPVMLLIPPLLSCLESVIKHCKQMNHFRPPRSADREEDVRSRLMGSQGPDVVGREVGG